MTAAAPRPIENPSPRPTPVRRASYSGRVVRAAYVASLVVADIVAAALAFAIAYRIYVIAEERPTRVAPLESFGASLVVLVVSLVVTFALYRLYLPRRSTSHVDRLASIAWAVVVGNGMALIVAFFTRSGLDMPRELVVYSCGLSIVLIWLTRSLLEQGLRTVRRAGLDRERVLIIGAGDEGRTLRHKIAIAPELGYEVVGFVDDRRAPRLPIRWAEGWDADVLPVLGPLADLSELLRRHRVTQVVVADPSLSYTQILDIVAVCDRARLDVQVVPDVFHLVVQDVSASEFGGMPMLRVRDVSLRGWNLRLKRAMDLALASMLLILFAPLLLLVAVAVKVNSPDGPVFFIQTRVGIDGRRFPCIKFRSMRPGAEDSTGPVWATPDDDRTTCVGRMLRRYSIDELPQLVNVLLGDMSLVGPRPERPVFVEQFSRLIPRYDKRHQEKAGMTGWAQVNGLRGQAPIEERTRYDLFYVERWSPAFDLKILLKTIGAVLRGRDAY